MKTLSEGQYVTIEEDEYNRLIITATKEARNLRARGELWVEDRRESDKVYILLADHLITYSDWAIMYPDEIGALVGDDCLILSNDYFYREDEKMSVVMVAGWYHERYATELFSEQVFEGGVMMLPVPVQEEVTE